MDHPRQLASSRRPRGVNAPSSRLVATILFALQVLVWGGGSVLEARAAAESLTRLAHVEDTGNPTCPPIHSHLDCLVCRTFSGGAATGSAPSLAYLGDSADCRPQSVVIDGSDRASGGPLGSRAPPRA